jgi:large subunit ribosomal protein L35
MCKCKVKKKTNKAVVSRFKVTGTGKLMRLSPGKRHKLEKKSSRRKRRLEHEQVVDHSTLDMYKQMMGV